MAGKKKIQVSRKDLEDEKSKLVQEIEKLEVQKRHIDSQLVEIHTNSLLFDGEKDIVGKWFRRKAHDVIHYVFCEKREGNSYLFRAVEITENAKSAADCDDWVAAFCGDQRIEGVQDKVLFQFHPPSLHKKNDLVKGRFERVSELELPLLLGVGPETLLEKLRSEVEKEEGFLIHEGKLLKITGAIVEAEDFYSVDAWR